MPVTTYETLFLLDPNKVSADADGDEAPVHHILERHGATIVVSRPWDYNHKLAYPIGKQKKGASTSSTTRWKAPSRPSSNATSPCKKG